MSRGSVVYIGNVPFDYTEFDVQNIASTVGSVISVKLIFDQLTGQSKGFAFVEYADSATAASAVRNLDNFQVGNRILRCGYKTGNDEDISFNLDGTLKLENSNDIKSIVGINSTKTNDGQEIKRRKVNAKIPPLPAGIPVPQGQKALNIISSTLKTFDQQRLLNILKDSKEMSLRDPKLMSDLLDQCPQLSSAIIEILLSYQLISSEDIRKLLINPPNQQENTKKEVAKITDPEQLEAIKQVISLTPEQFAGLDEEQRKAILQIQENYHQGVYGNI